VKDDELVAMQWSPKISLRGQWCNGRSPSKDGTGVIIRVRGQALRVAHGDELAEVRRRKVPSALQHGDS
jgi:hypothetical protein